jgi:hypothetical protein
MTSDPARRLLDSLPARGRWWFTLDDAVAGLGGTRDAAYMALSRLRRKRLIASPYRGFYRVLPPEPCTARRRPGGRWSLRRSSRSAST